MYFHCLIIHCEVELLEYSTNILSAAYGHENHCCGSASLLFFLDYKLQVIASDILWKCISEVLANRMNMLILCESVEEKLYAFVASRQISAWHFEKLSWGWWVSRFDIKVNRMKAFDTVNWRILLEKLRSTVGALLGFLSLVLYLLGILEFLLILTNYFLIIARSRLKVNQMNSFLG